MHISSDSIKPMNPVLGVWYGLLRLVCLPVGSAQIALRSMLPRVAPARHPLARTPQRSSPRQSPSSRSALIFKAEELFGTMKPHRCSRQIGVISFQFTTYAPLGMDFDEGCHAHHHEQDPGHDIYERPTRIGADADSARNHHVLKA